MEDVEMINVEQEMNEVDKSNPLTYFAKFIDDDTFEDLGELSSEYFEEKNEFDEVSIYKKNKLDTNLIKIYLGINMYMGIVKMPSKDYYWKQNKLYRNLKGGDHVNLTSR
jgi:hypothetical protein